MKKTFVFALALVMVLGIAGIAFAGISGSAHDLASGSSSTGPYSLGTGTSQVCVFCHHPHRGAVGAGSTVKNDLLWNMDSFSQTAYQTYQDSGSINAVSVGDLNPTNSPQSFLCMACHDGTIGTNSLVTAPADGGNITTAYNLTGGYDLGTTLADDHPVNIEWPTTDNLIATNSGNMVNGAQDVNNEYPLYGANGVMQCGTCHDVHAGGTSSASTTIDFMRGDTVGSEICYDCHLGK